VVGGIVGGILGTALLLLIGIVIFLVQRRNTCIDQTPELPTSRDNTNKPGEVEGGRMGKFESGENIGGRLRYDGILNVDGVLQSDD
jgi:hypothetical protein